MKTNNYYLTVCWICTSLVVSFAQPTYIYEGGPGGASNSIQTMQVNSYLYKGGNNEGYNNAVWTEANLMFYLGGNNEGYNSSNISGAPSTTFFEGGKGDGFSMVEKCVDFIWTGAIGTGWAVSGNWNYNQVPDLKRRAIIPSGTPSNPFINSGIFSIGENPNNALFVCGQLWIQDGALLVTRANNYVENYGNIVIDGTMNVRNQSMNSFQNLTGGIIRISSTGSLEIKP